MEQLAQHIWDKATTDCGLSFGVLCVVITVLLYMWRTDRKNLLATIIKMQENVSHASENMEKIILALASRSQSPGD